MKLRNKKTGEIVTLDSNHDDSLADFGGKILVETKGKEFSYRTLAELNEDWEDYTTAEPLIKNEKVRKAVRWWADYNGDKEVIYFVEGDGSSKLMSYRFEIDFFNEVGELKDGEKYTIAELCGEEEE